MSQYDDYQTTSLDYDSTRVPVGMEIVLGCLGALEKPLSELTLLVIISALMGLIYIIIVDAEYYALHTSLSQN